MPETLNYQNRAIAYSVLAHIYDKGTLAHGPLDIFIPIVKNALSELYPLGVVKGNSMKEITDAIEKKFSLVIPISVLNNILKVIVSANKIFVCSTIFANFCLPLTISLSHQWQK